MNNTIPRKFKLITGKMLIATNASNVNDIVEITKNDNGYTLINTRTKETFQCFISMIRNKDVFELISIQ